MKAPSLNVATVIAWQDGQARLALPRDACAGCGKRCGIGHLAASRAPAEMTLPVGEKLTIGQQIEVQFDDRDLLRAALLGYLLPATLLVLGAIAGHILLEAPLNDAGTALGALAGLTFGLRLARRLTPCLRQPRLIFPFRAGDMR